MVEDNPPSHKIHLEAALYELESNILLSAKARRVAERRLTLHTRFSQWTVALISVALIFEAAWAPLELPMHVSDAFIDVTQLSFAVLILAYSLLLGAENFAVRAERMRVSRGELQELHLEQVTVIERGKGVDLDTYSEIASEYDDIVIAGETFSSSDLRIATIDDDPWSQRLGPYLLYYGQFAHYVIVLVAVLLTVLTSICLSCVWTT